MITVNKIATLVAVLVFVACGGDKKGKGKGESTTPEGLVGATHDVAEDRSRCEDEGHRVENTDLNDVVREHRHAA